MGAQLRHGTCDPPCCSCPRPCLDGRCAVGPVWLIRLVYPPGPRAFLLRPKGEYCAANTHTHASAPPWLRLAAAFHQGPQWPQPAGVWVAPAPQATSGANHKRASKPHQRATTHTNTHKGGGQGDMADSRLSLILSVVINFVVCITASFLCVRRYSIKLPHGCSIAPCPWLDA